MGTGLKAVGPSRALVGFALVCLCLQNSALVVSMKYTRSVLKETYLTSTAVVLMECVKFALSWLMMYRDGARTKDVICQPSSTSTHSATPASHTPAPQHRVTGWLTLVCCSPVCVICYAVALRRSMPLCVPSLLYVMQNSLQFVAVNHLDASTFTILSQLKILTTAVCSVSMLGTRLSLRKWRALVLLVIGAILVQLPTSSPTGSSASSRTSLAGMAAVLGMVCLSGIAGVWLEMFLKNKDAASLPSASHPPAPAPSIWERNLQLSLYGILFGLSSVLANDYQAVQERGFFQSYSAWTVLVVVIAAVGGLIVALVVKYTNTIVKGFAASISIILTSLCSMALFPSDELGWLFWLGAACVLLSIFNYNEEDSGSASSSVIGAVSGGKVSEMDVTVSVLEYKKVLEQPLMLAGVVDDLEDELSEGALLLRRSE